MNHLAKYRPFTPLVSYPDAGLPAAVERCTAMLGLHCPEAAATLAPFAQWLAATPLHDQEEVYARTFHIQAICYLDLGFVLFGEDYKRGEFLVNMKREQALAGNHCGDELPDNLANVLNLLQNYRSAFLHLAQYHLSRRENDEVVRTLDRMGQVMPEYVIPTSDFRINEAIGLMYAQAGRPEELTKRYRNMIENEYGRLTAVNDKLSFADYLNYRGQRALAESLAQEVIKQNPAQREGYQWLARLYSMTGERDKAVTALEQLLARFPDDQAARTQLEQLRGTAPAPVDTSHSSN
ncbi:tetratricopeptide repeat protein [Cytophagia bacterium CHB2]|nr:tetratricopeptide repeat protein [Cytophagia bacterium CHB2]